MNKKEFAETLKQAKGQQLGNVGTGNPASQKAHHGMRWTALLVSALVLTASCAEKNAHSEQAAKNEQAVKQYFDHFNSHDWQKMADMYADNAEFKDPSAGKEIVAMSKPEIVAKYSELAEVFPDLKNNVIQTYPSGDTHVVVEFVTVGTAADGSALELPICTIFAFENGKIAKDFSYYDNF
ncbi:MAG: nuclear transport factor 2 family protein [Prevotellaceae bacterium]|jgi:steroid delta-isomerase-like uncharacterized protein|nr:nuclear transport factor 2 family protein [Prevotellaceae bacterium]